jgi:hypothetical protein
MTHTPVLEQVVEDNGFPESCNPDFGELIKRSGDRIFPLFERIFICDEFQVPT